LSLTVLPAQQASRHLYSDGSVDRITTAREENQALAQSAHLAVSCRQVAGLRYAAQTNTPIYTPRMRDMTPRRAEGNKNRIKSMVGVTGFEPATSTSQTVVGDIENLSTLVAGAPDDRFSWQTAQC
jgi:hypothetical protein